jgi:hypothetical protein
MINPTIESVTPGTPWVVSPIIMGQVPQPQKNMKKARGGKPRAFWLVPAIVMPALF